MKIGVVTGTRADYGLLRPVLTELRADDTFELQLIATGTHLAPEFGTTVNAIEADGFVVTDRVEMLLASDTPVGVTTSLGLATLGLAASYDRLRPDLLMVLGDRYEILAAAQAALVAGIPVAHLCGGDITEGAIDDAIRHAITKLSHLHFVTNPDAARRVRQMGENPSHVVVAGNPSLDELARLQPMSRGDLQAALGLELRDRNVLVTYHPATLADEPPAVSFEELLAALDALGPDVGVVLTLPNADTWGRVLIGMTRDYARTRDHVVAHDSLGQVRYGSCLKTFDAVVGNSSSGLMEAPAVGTPAVNIGERQRGRLRARSTIDCTAERHAIESAIRQALAWRDVPADSPYGDGHAAERIMAMLRTVEDPRALLDKHFHHH